MTTGLQVAGQIEQYRMNDAKLTELNQTMRIRDQQHQWEKVNQAFTERLQPLQFQAQQYDLQNKFRAQAEQRMSPFLTDIKGEFQQLIMDRPELAAEAQSIYARSIDGVLNKTLSDPNADIASELERNKASMRSWIEKTKIKQESPNIKVGGLLGAGIDAANKVLGTKFDPLARFKETQKSATLTTDQTSRAASIYSTTFGGVPQDFLRKHDELYKSSNDSTYRIMMATGQLTSQEDYNRLSPSRQAEVASAIEKKQKGTILRQTLDDLQKEIDNYVDNNAKSEGAYTTTIDRLKGERQRLQEIYNKDILGVSYNVDDAPAASNLPTKDEIIRSIPTGSQPATSTTQSTALKDMLSSDFSNVESIIRDVSAVDNDELQGLKNKYISNPSSVSRSDIQKLISKATPDRIESLAGADWFRKHIEDNNLDVTYDSNSEYVEQSKTARAIQVLTTQSRPLREDYLSSSPKRFFSSERDRLWTDKEKEDARKVLKSELPNILFDYLNQNR